MEIKEELRKIVSENDRVTIVDKDNDNAFAVLFGVASCSKSPVAYDDLYGKHILLERFFKKDKASEIAVKSFPISAEGAESAYLYYKRTAKSLLEFLYRNGYSDKFQPDSGSVSVKLAVIESDDYYDLYGYYGYEPKEELV